MGGNVLRTSTVEDSNKPAYMTKLIFPIYYPVHNDKIVIRLWDQRKLLSDVFIAAIPEIPTENDYFNVKYLLSKRGIMPYRWVNNLLYLIN